MNKCEHKISVYDDYDGYHFNYNGDTSEVGEYNFKFCPDCGEKINETIQS